jgi:hypothetical protein
MTAGYYEMCAGGVDPTRGYIVTITRRDDLKGWIAAARWDRFLYTDPVPTLRQAKRSATSMINGIIESETKRLTHIAGA